jgi:hypothetical protein
LASVRPSSTRLFEDIERHPAACHRRRQQIVGRNRLQPAHIRPADQPGVGNERLQASPVAAVAQKPASIDDNMSQFAAPTARAPVDLPFGDDAHPDSAPNGHDQEIAHMLPRAVELFH